MSEAQSQKYSLPPQSQRIPSQARSRNTNRTHTRSNYTQSKLSQTNISKRSTNRAERTSQLSKGSKKYSKTRTITNSLISEYNRLSNTTVSNPGNLICDNCVNKNEFDKKLQNLENEKAKDVEFANEINKELLRQLEEERAKDAEKRRIYKDALENQRGDMEERLREEVQKREEEDERIRKALADDSDIVKRDGDYKEKKRKYIEGLKGQLRDNEEKIKYLDEQEKVLDARNPNLLIDDGWRGPAREAMKEYYKNNLLNQMKEKDQQKADEEDFKKNQDKEYTDRLKDLIAFEEDKKKELNAKKRKIFLDELQKQLEDKELADQRQRDLKDKEADDVNNKLKHDNDVYMQNMFKKKGQIQGYIEDLKNQMVGDDQKKNDNICEMKKAVATGMNMGHKPRKCYNCANCLKKYPVKRLNKRKMVKK